MMAAPTLNLKRGSIRKVRMKLTDGTGAALTLSDATSVRFQMRAYRAAELKVDSEAIVIDPAQGLVEYSPTELDVDTPGQYWAEWRVTYAGGDIVVPEQDYINVTVHDDLATG